MEEYVKRALDFVEDELNRMAEEEKAAKQKENTKDDKDKVKKPPVTTKMADESEDNERKLVSFTTRSSILINSNKDSPGVVFEGCLIIPFRTINISS